MTDSNYVSKLRSEIGLKFIFGFVDFKFELDLVVLAYMHTLPHIIVMLSLHTTLHTQALNLVALFNVYLFVCQIFGTRASTKISNRSVPCLCFCCYLLFPVCANVCFFGCGGTTTANLIFGLDFGSRF